MHGLAVLHHDVVRNIHEVVDRAHAGIAEPLTHPGRGGRDLHVLHHAGGVAAAECRLLHDDAGEGIDIPAGLRLHHGGMELQLLVEGHGGFARQPDHAEAVRAVRGDFELDHVVVTADHGGDVVAGPDILMQDEDAVLDAVGELLLLGMEVTQLADFSLPGVVGNEVAEVEIRTGSQGLHALGAQVQDQLPAGFGGADAGDFGGQDGSEDLVTGGDAGRHRRRCWPESRACFYPGGDSRRGWRRHGWPHRRSHGS